MENQKYLQANNRPTEFDELIKGTSIPPISLNYGFSTRCIHEGQHPDPVHGAVNVPIYMSSTFAQKAPAQPYGKFDYTRCGNPTIESLETCLASLEHGKYCVTTSSGCGATMSICSMVKTGEHILSCDDVYGGTNRQFNKILKPKFGIEVDFVDLTDLAVVEKSIKPNTRILWIETPSNPTLKICDIEALCTLAKKHNIITVVDNTFASPYFQSPLLLGADIVYHSMSKYLGGHSDIIAGCAITNSEDLYNQIHFNMKTLGPNMSAFDSYIMLRGVKTLKIRMISIHRNATIIAKFLENHPKIEKVLYPGLESHPQHETAKKQMRGFSGMISFYIKGGRPEADKMLKAVKVITLAESLGGVESLIEYPFIMTHGSVPPEQRDKLGINDKLIRLSVGIEDIECLLGDLKQALE